MAEVGEPRVLREIIAEIERALAGGAPVAVATVVVAGEGVGAAVGAKLLVRRDGTTVGGVGGEAVDAGVQSVALATLERHPRSASQTVWVNAAGEATVRRSQARPGDAQLMLELFESPARLIIVGGGHVGLALARLGSAVGFSITVLDDREEFADRERFPMADEVLSGDIGKLLDELRLDESSYVVLVSRGHLLDEQALRHAVGRGAAYVGMIGSRRRTQAVLQHLVEDEFRADDLERVYTPIGLDIGAETPEEIAVAILAEIVMVQNGGSGAMLSRMPHRRASG